MTKEQIKSAITEQILMITPDIEEVKIVADENLQRSLEIDSYDFLQILTGLNDQLGVEAPESDYGRVDTLEHMVDYFAARV